MKTPYKKYEESEGGIQELITENVGLVKSLASQFDVTFQPAVAFDDLVSAGMVGLVEAAHRYKEGEATKFSTFAYQRIRGAMLDLLRAHDPLGKSARSRLSEIRKAIRKFRADNRRNPSIEELADLVQCSRLEVLRYLSYEKWDYMSSLNQNFEEDMDGNSTALDALLQADVDTPLEKLEKSELSAYLAECIKKLTEREQQVVVMYYYEELYMAEIAEVLGVTQSRVSQIHTKALFNLGRKLREVVFNER